MPRPRHRSCRFGRLTPLLLLVLVGCAQQQQDDYPFDPLRPPVPSPPGDWPLEQRIDWWESEMSGFDREDQTEAHLRLGELYLEAGQPESARVSFRQAAMGHLNLREQAQVERGLGLSYLLEGFPEAGVAHLETAMPHLGAPEREECSFILTQLQSGTGDVTADPNLLARVQPYLSRSGIELDVQRAQLASGPIEMRRQDWRARPTRGNIDPMTRPYRLTVHHSATPLNSTDYAASVSEVRNIQQFHQNSRGWADIGYHFLIDRAGRVIQGRSLSYQGAHAGNRELNRGNIGICLLGNFVAQPERGSEFRQPQRVNADQWQALDELVGWLRSQYGIESREVHAHSEVREGGTQCPGPELIEWVKRYRGGAGSGAIRRAGR